MCFGPQADGLQGECNYTRGFVLLLTLYVYSSSVGTFCPIPSMPAGVPTQLLNAAKALQAVEQGEPGLIGKSYAAAMSTYRVSVLLCCDNTKEHRSGKAAWHAA